MLQLQSRGKKEARNFSGDSPALWMQVRGVKPTRNFSQPVIVIVAYRESPNPPTGVQSPSILFPIPLKRLITLCSLFTPVTLITSQKLLLGIYWTTLRTRTLVRTSLTPLQRHLLFCKRVVSVYPPLIGPGESSIDACGGLCSTKNSKSYTFIVILFAVI